MRLHELIDAGPLADRLAATSVGISGTFTLGASVMHSLNEYLQAGAFVVAIISGIAATLYYARRTPPSDD